jgi:signal transduction histidine kinase
MNINNSDPRRHRVLLIDDNEAIHGDLRKILQPRPDLEDDLNELEASLFGTQIAEMTKSTFELDSAYQGQDGLRLLEKAWEEGRPYAAAFVDVRMPPGWDGIETIGHLWKCDPNLQVVICTAYTDYSWRDIVHSLGESHNFVILKKPFDNIEVLQLAHALTSKREATLQAAIRLEELELEVIQRRQAERSLLSALDAAEESNRCKRSFLATMGHELRTPLNAILGYSEMLEADAREMNAPAFIPGLQKVQMAGKHLLGLINDILDMSRIESGRMPLHIGSVSVRLMAREVLEMTSPLAKANGNRLELKVAEENIMMDVDETRFRQCLLNLLGNACKFTSAGMVTLEVNRIKEPDQDWLAWSVRDTGIGIAEDQVAKLFQPFTQVDSAANRKFGGSGLGLAISRRLCEMMGGAIDVVSKPGEGSTFTIRIPACADTVRVHPMMQPVPCPEDRQMTEEM